MGQPVPTHPGEQTTWFRQSGSWLTLSLRPDVFVKMSRPRGTGVSGPRAPLGSAAGHAPCPVLRASSGRLSI